MEWLVSVLVLIVASLIGIYIIRSYQGFGDTGGYKLSEKFENKEPVKEKPSPETDAQYSEFMRQIRARTGNSSVVPTKENLDLISGQEETDSQYKPHQEIIYPHETPRGILPAITAVAPTDAGTQAEKIQLEAFVTPSVREMVRKDGPEDDQKSPYAITYEHKTL